MEKKRRYNKRETPKGVLCSVCKMRFKDFLEISKHIVANKDTHTDEDLQRAARSWVAWAARTKNTGRPANELLHS